MQVKKATAIGVLATAAIGIAILLTAVPSERRLELSLDSGRDPETVRYGHELLDSAVARFLDPDGHDRLKKALEIQAGTRARDGFRIDHDATIAADFHRIAIDRARVLGLAALALILAGSLIGFVLWIGDRRSGLWIGASTFLVLAFFPIGFAFATSVQLGFALLGLQMIALSTVGRQSVTAMRLRTPEEIT